MCPWHVIITKRVKLYEMLNHIPQSDLTSQSIACNNALLLSLKVSSGKEAVQLLYSSFRIREDLGQDLIYPEFFKSKIVVRRYRRVDPSMEFRGFVHHKQLTCLSQYESGLYFPNLPPLKQQISSQIQTFFETISPLISQRSYIIDIAILPNNQIVVVELNPFHSNTSGCTFGWGRDRDQILGKKEFLFRIVEEPLKNPLERMPISEMVEEFYASQSYCGLL